MIYARQMHIEKLNLQSWSISKALKKLQEYEDLEEQGKLLKKWIPCSERLPEESLGSVIGWDAYRKRPCFVQRLGGRWILGDDVDFVHITA